jgi:hypothetical protein
MSWPALPQRDEQFTVDPTELSDRTVDRLLVKSTTGDPTDPGDGFVYVNLADKKVRCYADGAWRDLETWV